MNSGLAKGETVVNDPGEWSCRNGCTVEGVFEYLDSRMNRWAAEEEDVRLHGYWYCNYWDEYHQVAQWDTIARLIYIQPPYHPRGYGSGIRFYGLNLFCEIDRPGEWYLSRATGLLYWYPPEGIDPTRADVRLTTFADEFMVCLSNSSHLRFEGLSFRDGRGTAVTIRAGRDDILKDCRIERFGKHGVYVLPLDYPYDEWWWNTASSVSGYDHGITGCYLSHLGGSGIKLFGGLRKTLTPANFYVENTVIQHFSLRKRTDDPAVLMTGCGMRVSNNRIQHASANAFLVTGNDMTIEYNQISHVVNEADDCGGFDMSYNLSFRGNVLRYNYWADIGGKIPGFTVAAIRLDGMISGQTIYGNIVERCGSGGSGPGLGGFGAVAMTLGKDNLVENNIFYKCHKGISYNAWGRAGYLKLLYSDYMQQLLYESVDVSSDIYLSKYPELASLLENVEINTSRNNLIIDCTTPFEGNFQRVLRISNTPVMNDIANDPTFCLDRKIEKYHLQPIPIENIGPKNNRWMALYPNLYDPVEASEFLKLRMHCNTADFENDTDDERPFDN
jgi:hypothetical protein